MASHEVRLEWPTGRTKTVTVREDETVLEAAGREGIGLPYGCRTGACGTCTGRLLEATGRESGDDQVLDVDDAFAYRRCQRALKDRHRSDGYVLLCVAEPRADCRLAVGPSVHTELVENPWK